MRELSKKLFRVLILTPIAGLWFVVHYFRRIFYDYGVFKQRSFQVPIISVGNLTFGGTGKTPFTLWLSDYLNFQNKKVMILMRGYKGRLEKQGGILEAGKKINSDPEDFGDEALLFSRRLRNASVVVGKNRSENLSFYFPKSRPDVVILEDGHQHIKIKRKLNVIMFDALMPKEKYQIAPLGYMREGFYALKDADLVVIGRVDQVKRDEVEFLRKLISPYISSHTPIAEICYRPKGFFNASYDLVYTTDQIKEKKVVCLAGIANPESFFKSIEELEAQIVSKEIYPDHHNFKLQEVKSVVERAKNENAIVVTTEKDMVRIKKIINDDLIVFLEVDVKFISGEKEAIEKIEGCFKNIY